MDAPMRGRGDVPTPQSYRIPSLPSQARTAKKSGDALPRDMAKEALHTLGSQFEQARVIPQGGSSSSTVGVSSGGGRSVTSKERAITPEEFAWMNAESEAFARSIWYGDFGAILKQKVHQIINQMGSEKFSSDELKQLETSMGKLHAVHGAELEGTINIILEVITDRLVQLKCIEAIPLARNPDEKILRFRSRMARDLISSFSDLQAVCTSYAEKMKGFNEGQVNLASSVPSEGSFEKQHKATSQGRGSPPLLEGESAPSGRRSQRPHRSTSSQLSTKDQDVMLAKSAKLVESMWKENFLGEMEYLVHRVIEAIGLGKFELNDLNRLEVLTKQLYTISGEELYNAIIEAWKIIRELLIKEKILESTPQGIVLRDLSISPKIVSSYFDLHQAAGSFADKWKELKDVQRNYDIYQTLMHETEVEIANCDSQQRTVMLTRKLLRQQEALKKEKLRLDELFAPFKRVFKY